MERDLFHGQAVKDRAHFGFMRAITHVDTNSFGADQRFHHCAQRREDLIKRPRKTDALAPRPGEPGGAVALPFCRHVIAESGRGIGVGACGRFGVHKAENVPQRSTFNVQRTTCNAPRDLFRAK